MPAVGGERDVAQARVRVGLQGIYAADRSVVAHELLFRAPGRRDASLTGTDEHDQATAQVIIATFAEFGVDQLADGKPLFLNTTRSFFTGQLPLPFDSQGVVLELLETVHVDEPVLDGVRRLRQRGFAIAVDDFDGEPHRVPALPYADYVKLDLQASGERLPRVLDLVRQENSQAKIVVERIETIEQFRTCTELGIELFQGYHLHRPDVVHKPTISVSQVTCVQLIALLHDPRTSTDDISRLLTSDAGLSLRILKTVGSAAHAPRQGITSLHQAVVMLGCEELAAWVTLVLVSGSAAESTQQETLRWIFTRAEACRLLAPDDADAGFTVGLLSAAAMVLGVDPAVLTQGCALAPAVQAALLHRRGRLGATLKAVVAHELATVGATGVSMAQSSRPGSDHDGITLPVGLPDQVHLTAALAARSRVHSLATTCT